MEVGIISVNALNRVLFISHGTQAMWLTYQLSADKYEVVENFTTQPGARTITVDQTTHHNVSYRVYCGESSEVGKVK